GGTGDAGQAVRFLVDIMNSEEVNIFTIEASNCILAMRHIFHDAADVKYLNDVAVMQFCLFAGQKNQDLADIDDEAWCAFMKEQEKNKGEATAVHGRAAWVGYQLLRWGDFYEKKLVHDRLSRIYYNIEQPLFSILARMEETGVVVDMERFQTLARETDEKIKNLQTKIFKDLGKEFNLSSPRQLGEVLFVEKKIGGDKLGKTKTGQFSTSVDVLEGLAGDYPVVADILQHRHLEKLNNTYIRALPLLAKKDRAGDYRLHSHMVSTGAQTGRFSSINPNLQNIPVRTAEGIKLRECFIAPKGRVLLSLDYSQIELRILALLSGVEALKKTFLAGGDIHASTASEIFEVPLADITPELRRRAKAVNFGIIYGISPFGLARQLQISQAEAKDIIQRYFAKLPGIKNFMDDIVAQAEQSGFVSTLFGRRIYLPAIATKGPARAYAVRQAMNAPLQGTAADLIKRAMRQIEHHLQKNKLEQDCKMILQIHDELLFEVAEDKVAAVVGPLKDIMSRVSLFGMDRRHWQHYWKLHWHDQKDNFLFFPVEDGVGKNWREAH
ncbi:MAG: DNA polymerase, partial [Alphaproteobacteria bacterium]|nr:DNA polymerase [Alphaproteobacteria bacterium]